MSTYEIRPTTASDIPALQKVLDQTGLFPAELLAPMISPALAGESEAFWLTCHSGAVPSGFCYTVPEALADGVWNMQALAIHPDMQGRGLGTALVAALESRLRDMGQRLLIVDTSGTDDFALTRHFYTRNGYEPEARIRDFWAVGDDKVTFRKAL